MSVIRNSGRCIMLHTTDCCDFDTLSLIEDCINTADDLFCTALAN